MSLVNDWTVEGFLEALSTKSPTPGGGSAVAVMGAMGAALVSMVANLTIGKKGYESLSQEMMDLSASADALRSRILDLVDADVAAFGEVMEAYGLPKESEEERVARSAAIQDGLKSATQVPLACAEICVEIIALSEKAAEMGNRNVVTDAGVAVFAAHAGFRSALLNVRVNTSSIRDPIFVEEAMGRMSALSEGLDLKVEDICQRVIQRM